MPDNIDIGFGLDARGFISGARSLEDQTVKSTQALMRAFQSSARSVNGLSDAIIATKAQTLLNLGVTKEQVNAFKSSAVSLRQYKEELKRVGDEYQNDSAKLDAHMARFGKQNNLLSLAAIRTRELKAEEAALAAQRAARATADAGKTAGSTGGRYRALSEAGGGTIDTRGIADFNARIDAATGKVKQLTVAMLGIGSVKQLANMADEWTTVNNRLRLVVNSTAELQQVRSQLMASANNTGQAIGTVAELYNKLAMSQAQTGISGSKLLKLTDTINKSMVIGGGAAESQAAALVQLSQAFASGTLRGEELNSVLEQAPGLAQTLAKGLGVTVGQLRSLAAAGKLTSDAVANAILKQADDVNAQFAKMDKTIGQSATVLKNKVMAFTGALNETTGASRKAGAAMEWLGNHLGLLSAAAGTVAAVYAGKYAASVAIVITRKYAEIAASEKSVAAMLKEAAAARLLAAAKAGSAGAPASGAAGAAAGALSTAGSVAGMAAGGWVGLAAGLATAAYAYYEVRQASKSVNSALQTQIGTLDELIAKYKQASEVEKQAMLKQAKDNYQQYAKEFSGKLNDLKERYIGLIGYGNTKNMPIASALATINSLMGDVAAGRKSIEEVTVILNKLFGIKPDSKLAGELAQQSVAINEVGVQTNGFADQVNAMGGVASKFKVAGNEIAAGAQVANAAIQKLTETQQKNIDLLKKQKGLMDGGLSSGVAEAVAKASAEGMSGEELKKYTQLQQQQESLKRQIDNINSVTDTLKSLGKSADEARAELLGGKDGLTLFQLASKEATSAQMEQAKQYLAQSKAYKEQLQNQQTLQGMTQQMQEAYAELAGGKAGLIAYRLSMNHATAEQIKQAQEMNSLTEAIQKQQSVMATLSSLQEQVATLGMDSVQRQLYSLRKEGATPEQLRQAEAMLKQIKSFDEAQKDTKAAARDLSAAASALKDSSSTEDSTKPLSIFSKEYRDREEAYWTKKRQEERDGSNIGFLSGRPAVVLAWQNNGITQPPGFQNFNQSGKNEMLKPTESILVNLTNGNKTVTFKALFNQTGGAREFKELWNQTLHETARDLT
ncbi:tape measure protein [Snodgrassella alvi]|uniref:tape measure protein n=1 Tax=Snodgrassella alvi TaxID=1196083 RepID=UPI00351C55EE